MTVCLISFASELVKMGEAKDKERKGYGRQFLAAAPFAAVSAATDVPKGWLDSTVEQKLRGVAKENKKSSLRTGLARGTGKLSAGLITSPVFLSGIKDLRSDDPKKKREGYAKVVGSGLVFGSTKGAIESALDTPEARAEVKAKAKKALSKTTVGRTRRLAASRGIVGMGAAALTAATIAKATKKPEPKSDKADGPKKGKSLWGSYGMPAVVGAGIGAGKGAFDEVVAKGSKATARGIGARAGGRAAAGALGAAVLTGLVKKFTGDKKTKNRPGYRLETSKKDPTKRRWQKVASEQRPSMYDDVSSAPSSMQSTQRVWVTARSHVVLQCTLSRMTWPVEATQDSGPREHAYELWHLPWQMREHLLRLCSYLRRSCPPSWQCRRTPKTR